MTSGEGKISIAYLINEQITHREVRVIYNGKSEVMATSEALKLAEDTGMDLVLMSDNVKPAVCKIVNYNKMMYEREKKEKFIRKQDIKEIKMKGNIAEHDIDIKVNYARRILKEKDRVKVSVSYKGREIKNIDKGAEIIKGFISKIANDCVTFTEVKRDNNMVYTVLSPKL